MVSAFNDLLINWNHSRVVELLQNCTETDNFYGINHTIDVG